MSQNPEPDESDPDEHPADEPVTEDPDEPGPGTDEEALPLEPTAPRIG